MPRNDIKRFELPSIIQSGMGIGVSTWCHARTVAQPSELGVISGTTIDSVVDRELQDGAPPVLTRMAHEATPSAST